MLFIAKYFLIRYFGGENINKAIAGALVLLAVVIVAGGYAFISNDGSSNVIDNPVSNEIADVNNAASVSNDFNQEIVKDITSGIVFQQLSAVRNSVSLNSVANSVANSDNSSKATGAFMGYASIAASYGNLHSGDEGTRTYQSWDNSLNNINKDDYVLSPNYNDHIFIKKGQDFTDKYGLCVVDGFIPLGNVTKQINTSFICNLECGIGDSYFDLSSPYIYDTMDVIHWLKYGEFPDDVQKKQLEYQLNQLEMNYRKVDGQNEVFVNVHEDFTDKYMMCMDCGRYFALGDITTPLDGIMICDHPNHFGGDVYIDANNPSVVSPEQAYDSWNSSPYLQELYSNPDYHPVHFDEEGYGGEPQNDLLQQSSPDDTSCDAQIVESSDNIE